MQGPAASFGQTVVVGQTRGVYQPRFQGSPSFVSGTNQRVSVPDRGPTNSQSPGPTAGRQGRPQLNQSNSSTSIGFSIASALSSTAEGPRPPGFNSENAAEKAATAGPSDEVTATTAASAAATAAKAAELARRGQAAAAQAAKRTAAASPSSEFVNLVRSLEERVELMSKLQHARQQVPNKSGQLNGSAVSPQMVTRQIVTEPSSDPSASVLDRSSRQLNTNATTESASAALDRSIRQLNTSSLMESASQLLDRSTKAQLKGLQEEVKALRQEKESLLKEKAVKLSNEHLLSKENSELWAQLREQGKQITELTTAIKVLKAEGMNQIYSGPSDQDLEKEMQEVVLQMQQQSKECTWLKEQLETEQKRFKEAEHSWKLDKDRLERDIQQLAAPGPDKSPILSNCFSQSLPSVPSDVDGVSDRSPSLASHAQNNHPAIVAMQEQMTLQTQRIMELELKLQKSSEVDEDTLAPLPGPSLAERPTMPMPNGRGTQNKSGYSMTTVDPNMRLLSTSTLGAVGAMPRSPAMSAPGGDILPFSRRKMGLNLVLSEDGYTASRTKGCRQSVVIGEGPLARSAYGWYFEVEIKQTVLGWVGGLGIGVSLTSEAELRRVPDKAWRLPKTWIAGYWGRVFCDSKEFRTAWRADELQDGDVVGLLVTEIGELLVFVNGQQKCRVEAGIPVAHKPIFPVIDVFAATASVTLRKGGEPPPPPWDPPQAALSPPDSPVSSLRSGLSNLSFMEPK